MAKAGTKIRRKTTKVGISSRYEKQRGANGVMRGGVIGALFEEKQRELNLTRLAKKSVSDTTKPNVPGTGIHF